MVCKRLSEFTLKGSFLNVKQLFILSSFKHVSLEFVQYSGYYYRLYHG